MATVFTMATIPSLFKNFEQMEDASDVRCKGRPWISRPVKKIARVANDIEEQPETSTRRRTSQLQLSWRAVQGILHTDFLPHPYKIQSPLADFLNQRWLLFTFKTSPWISQIFVVALVALYPARN